MTRLTKANIGVCRSVNKYLGVSISQLKLAAANIGIMSISPLKNEQLTATKIRIMSISHLENYQLP